MPQTQELKNIAQDFVSIYQAKMQNLDSLFETTHLILNGFQEPLLKTKQVREEINAQLQDLLAKNEHLRRKDFDRMMQSILCVQVEKEKEIKNLVNSYLTEQKEMINLLTEHLTKIKDAIARGQTVGVRESQNTLTQILIQQDKRKQEVTSKLKEFQREQRKMTERLLSLLAKGRELRIKDLKAMLREFDISRRERLAAQEERKIEAQKRKESVRGMLGAFKRKRKELALNWRDRQKTNPPVRNPTRLEKATDREHNSLTAFTAQDKSDTSNGVHPVRKDISVDENFSNGVHIDVVKQNGH